MMTAEGRRTDPEIARPFIKWAGGKRQLLVELRKHVPERFGHYFEPFAGGAAFYFDLHAAGRIGRPGDRERSAVLVDMNNELMSAYRRVADGVEGVIQLLLLYERAHKRRGEKFYYELRSQIPSTLTSERGAARFIALNKLGFNGLYRVNKSGGFNVPYGKWKTPPTVCDADNLRACSRALDGTRLATEDFEKAVTRPSPLGYNRPAARGDFIYFDPPYWPAGGASDFTAYTAGGFGPEDHERLRDVALRLKKRGVSVLLSNADVDPVRRLYRKGFEMREVKALRAINSAGSKRGAVGELLIW